MDPELRAVLDRQEIIDVSIRYATALDTRDWALLRSCFMPDAVGQYDTIGNLEGYVATHEGYDAIEQLCQAALTSLDASQHLLANHVVEIAGDEGTVTLYFQAQHVRSSAPGGSNYIIAGRYQHRVVRTDEGWKIVHLHLSAIWNEGNPAVLAI